MSRKSVCKFNRLVRACTMFFLIGAFSLTFAITRWSTIQLIPDADILPGGNFLVDVDLAWELDTDAFSLDNPLSTQRVKLGLSEWVGLDIGYADGLVLGMKARVIKEDLNLWYVPSIAIGFQNLYTNREQYLFEADEGYPKNEFFAVLGKSSDWAMLRFHAGFLSAATSDDDSDRFNPFFGIEKYFGGGFYVNAEAQRRDRSLQLSFFFVFRPANDRFEFNLGVIDAPGASGRDEPKLYRPTLRTGIRILLGSGLNSLDALTGIEDRIDRQREYLRAIERRVDTLESELRWGADRIHELADLPADIRREERMRVIDELTKLRNFYDQVPFDPELVKSTVESIGARYDFYSPHLRVIVSDPEIDPRLRRIAISIIGEMEDQTAANILISLLGRFEDPSLKVEAMIALGKMRERRAREVLVRLQSDPDPGVSFTAREVHRQIFGDEAVTIEGPPSRPFDDGTSVPERRLGQ